MLCGVLDRTGKFAGVISGVEDYSEARAKLKNLGLIGYRPYGKFFKNMGTNKHIKRDKWRGKNGSI